MKQPVLPLQESHTVSTGRCATIMKVNVIDRKKEKLEVTPESEEDLWVIKTVLRPGDKVRGRTVRDVSLKGRGEKERRPITVTLEVKNVEFQPFTGKLRIFGVIVEGPEEYGLRGKHQSILVTSGKTITLIRDGGWPQRSIEKLSSSGPKGRAVIAAIDYDEYAIALLSPFGYKLVVEESLRLPGKDDPDARERILNQYIDKIAKTIVDEASKNNANLVIIGGPGPLKEVLAAKVRELARSLNVIVDNASMGGRAGVEEILRRQTLAEALKAYSVARAEHVMAEILREAASNPERVVFGIEEVLEASELGAVDTLLIIEDLVYSIDDEEREKANRLVENTEKYRGEVIFVPSDSPIGEKLRAMGGALARLRYPVRGG